MYSYDILKKENYKSGEQTSGFLGVRVGFDYYMLFLTISHLFLAVHAIQVVLFPFCKREGEVHEG